MLTHFLLYIQYNEVKITNVYYFPELTNKNIHEGCPVTTIYSYVMSVKDPSKVKCKNLSHRNMPYFVNKNISFLNVLQCFSGSRLTRKTQHRNLSFTIFPPKLFAVARVFLLDPWSEQSRSRRGEVASRERERQREEI